VVCTIVRLGDGLIRATRAVREQVVNDQPSDWEKEDKQAPEDLVDRWAVGLQHLHCRKRISSILSMISDWEKLTEDNDIENKNNETDDSTSSTELPCIAMALSRDPVRDRGSYSKADKEELEKHAECGSEHLEVSRSGSAKIW
jgi:hypothetical protein